MYKTAVIMAAGKGSRFHNLKKPKGFLTIGGKPLIEHSLQALADHGVERFVVGTGHLANYWEKYGKFSLKLVHNADYERCGSLQTLYRCRHAIYEDEDILLLDSDILYEPYCIGKLLEDPRPDLVLLGSSKGQTDCVWVDSSLEMSKNRIHIQAPLGVLVGITKISRGTLREVMDYASTPPAWSEHHDWAFKHTKTKFGLLVLNDLIFTEIDDDQQLAYASNVVYPKL